MAGPLTPRPGPGGPCGRPELARDVPHWDSLAPDRLHELERHAAECPSCGPALDLQRRAQLWLEARWREAGGPDPCPEAEELYDFGRGPGAHALGRRREEEISDHVLRCTSCREIVRTLEARPPVPILEPWAREPSETVRRPVPEPAPRERRGRILPFRRPSWVAAAALVATAAVAIGLLTERASSVRARGLHAQDAPEWPSTPLVRGAATDGALFPRGRVLAAPGGGALQHLVFEIRPVEGASYTVVLERTGPGAFDAGQTVATFSGSDPVLELPAELSASLEPGHYTWEAWVTENGLDRSLGARDFELRADENLAARVLALGDTPALADLVGLVGDLSAAGWATDARALARRAPPGPDRDRFLEGQTVR